MTVKARTLIVGAGISGLTTAVCLAEAGVPVTVQAAEPPERTTSACAGASWGPYLTDDRRVFDWSAESLTQFEMIAQAVAPAGVRLVMGMEAADFPMDPPDWARIVYGFRPCDPAELPGGYVSGWRYRIPLVSMPEYLAYLRGRAEAAGVTFRIERVRSIDDLIGAAPVIVNCAGLGARDLSGDDQLVPSRGQIVVVDNYGVTEFFQDWSHDADPTYLLPHGDRLVLGGSVQQGLEDVTPSPLETQAIIERCRRIDPRVGDPVVRETRVGIRPVRAQVRLEAEDRDGTRIVHNYGHGGSGVTLSWGCAHSVHHLAEAALS